MKDMEKFELKLIKKIEKNFEFLAEKILLEDAELFKTLARH